MKKLTTYYLEILVWSSSLVFVVYIDPAISSGFSICPFYNLGIEICPGCGLGSSISYFLRFSITESLHSHILGIPATLIILYRIVTLIILRIKYNALHRSLTQ